MEVKTFPKDMSNYEVDRSNPRRCFLSGLFEELVDFNGSSRKFYTYLNSNLSYNQPCVVVAVPNGISGPDYLEQSNWIQFANQHNVFLFLAVPEKEEWNLDGSDADYFNKVYLQINSRRSYVTMQDNIYAFGIGAGATVAQQAIMKMSTEWSGLATFADLDETVMLNAEVTQGVEQTGATELSVNSAKVQVPVWMSWTENTGINATVCDYWKTMNDVDEECYSNRWADEIYFPSKVCKKSQTNEEKISQVRVTNGFSGEPDLEYINAVWSYIGLACRHRGFGVKHLRYRINPEKYGFTYHTMEHGGFTRSWYEYVPEKLKASREPAPLVVCMHGRGGTAESFISLSGMSRVAEERDFIVVFPEAGVYQQYPNAYRNLLLWCGNYMGENVDDVGFILRMIEDVKMRNVVNTSRIYACGQSSGGMMTTTLAIQHPEIFAAVAPWSALVSPEEELVLPDKVDPAVPFMFLFGDKDFMCADEKDPQMDFKSSKPIAEFLKNLMRVYELNEKPLTYKCGEIMWYVYRNAKGTPMVTVGRVSNMPHANYPRESWIAYDEFLSKFSKLDDGTLLYMGETAL